MRSIFTSPQKTVSFALAPERVDLSYDPAPLVPDESYCRIWLVEVQWKITREAFRSLALINGEVRFIYGGNKVAIPGLIDLRHSQSFTSSGVFRVNLALTPLFPYRGGPVEIQTGLYRVQSSDDIQACLQTLVDISTLMNAPVFFQALPLSELLSTGIQRVLGGREVSLVLGLSQAVGADMGGDLPLRPGYFGGLLTDGAGFDSTNLCVVDDSLRLCPAGTAGKDFLQGSEPLPASVSASLLLRIEKVESRADWSAMPRINTLVRSVYEQMSSGDPESAHNTFRQAVIEVMQSDDLTKADRHRLVQAIQDSLKKWEDQLALLLADTKTSAAAIQEVSASIGQIVKAEEQARATGEKLAAEQPYPDVSEEAIFSIECDLNAPVRVNVIEKGYEGRPGDKILRLDPYKLARQAELAFAGEWRTMTKNLGEELFDKLFEDTIISDFYHRWLGKIHSEKQLHIRLRTPREFLRVPFECLVSKAHRDYLVLKHPLARTIIGEDVITRGRPLSPRLFNLLFREAKPLSVLLIASDTPPGIPQVDEEIEALADALPKFFAEKKIDVRVKSLLTEEATYETVKAELAKGDYHIIHYAGHGVYIEDAPEQSYLPFWEHPDRMGNLKKLAVPEIQWALESREALSFVYLSCCVGAAHGKSSHLVDNDYLGITDGLVQAYVPSILGFRWPALDRGAKNMALAFYRYLAQEGQVDTALLLARKELAQDRANHTWLSPILVLQA